MAAWLTPSAASQSASSSRPAVWLGEVRTSARARPRGGWWRAQATTLSLEMSRPAQWGYRVSIGVPLGGPRDGGQHVSNSFPCALARGEEQSWAGVSAPAGLVSGLRAPQ